jgi:GT2 family glycosyltransferase
MAYRRNVFVNNKFDETMIGYCMGEDVLFSNKLYREGKLLRIAKNARIDHRSSESNITFKQLVMIFAYRRYVLQNIIKNKSVAEMYYLWFAVTFFTSALILCIIGKRKWDYFFDTVQSHWYVIDEPDINKINYFLKGAN